MINFKKLIGKDARRITFSLKSEKEKDYHLLFSVIELLQEDMQDYVPVGKDRKPKIYRKDTEEANEYNVYMTIDWVTLDEDFMRDPGRHYTYNGTEIKFWSDGKFYPSTDSDPMLLGDSFNNNNDDELNVLPPRKCSKFLYKFEAKTKTGLKILQANEYLMDQLSTLSKEHYGIDLSEYTDLLDGIYFLQYNPYFVDLDYRSAKNGLYLTAKYRKGHAEELKVCISNKTKDGSVIGTYEETLLPSRSHYFIEFQEEPDIIDVKVFDKNGQCICQVDNITFIHAIHFDMKVKSKGVMMSVKDKDGNVQQVKVEKFATIRNVIGEQTVEDPETKKITEQRAYKKLEDSLDLVFFDGDKKHETENVEKAKSTLKKILAKASQRCIICDPYFNESNLVDYVLTMTSLDVEVKIIANRAYFGKDAASKTDFAKYIEKKIDEYNKLVGGKIEFRLLTGMSPLHDRFIIADDKVWMMGSSFNAFGSRATTLIRIPTEAGGYIARQIESWWGDNEKTISLLDLAKQIEENDEN